MIDRMELVQDRDRFTKRATGALVGLAVGDAMGDLGRDQEHRARFGIATELTPEAKSTDDTEFAILTARSLIDCGGELSPEAVTSAWKRYILDFGGAKKRAGRPLYGAIENLRRGLTPPESGRFNIMNDDDGAAMRMAGIGIYCAGDPNEAARLAEIDARISHDSDGVYAAQAVAASTAVAMVDGSVEDIIEAGRRFMPKGSWLDHATTVAMEICDRSGTIEKAYRELHTSLWTPEHAASAEAVPQMYAVFRLTGGDFHAGLLWSANFGRDADTISALTCSLNGALNGIDVIPAPWVAQVRKAAAVCLEFTKNEDLVSLGEEIAGLVCGECR
jgi:ADP-ribosylglycohydrolase